jgi:carboxylesterase type B
LPESEDCLRLNVYRPVGSVTAAGRPKTKPLPVVIYVHGGSFNTGHGGERNMASFVSWAKEDILAVSFNYRTGPFGFLPSALTAREGLLNLGLKDQQALFRWVKENIGAFGGDAENITIMGLSAGAHSVGHHVVYYGNSSTPAPFQKAILESGACTARAVFYPTHPRHLVQFREFLVAAGVEGVPEREVFDALRKLDGKTLNAASKKVWAKYTDSVTWPFQPVIDGPNPFSNSSNVHSNTTDPVVPDLPFHSWQKGHNLRIPVLTGFNTNEGTMFVPPNADTNEDFRSFFGTLIPGFSKKDLDDLEKLYLDPTTDPSSPYRSVPEGMGRQWARLDAAYSDYAYICPVLQSAHFLSTNTATSNSPSFSKSTHGTRETEGKSPVYVYHYAAVSKWGTANHGDEAAIVAHDMSVIASGLTPVAVLTNDTTEVNPSPVSQKPGLRAISDAMHTAWVNFIVSKDGNPNPLAKTGEEWPAFESPFGGKGNGRLVKFGEGNDERVEAGSSEGVPMKVEELTERELQVCRFWWERVEISQGIGRRLNQSRL